MNIELNDLEIYEIISKYTNIPFGIEDEDKTIISSGAVREAILCGYEVIHKDDVIGKDSSYYEQLRKVLFCEHIRFVKNNSEVCICYYCQNKACDKARCKQCHCDKDVTDVSCSSCGSFVEPTKASNF